MHRNGTRRNDLRLIGASFAYDVQTRPLFEGLTMHCARGWTGVVGANGAGKSTLLMIASGLLEPTAGVVERPGSSLYCPQRTDDPPQGFEAFLEALDGDAAAWRQRLGIEPDWRDRWPTLSHGERKRAQMAVALWKAPALLAVDEPTNHVDAAGRALIARALDAFEGVGLLVSHDRELLDALCFQCLFFDPPRATVRRGAYTEGAEQEEVDRERDRRDHALASAEVRRLSGEATRWREDASRAGRRRSKRGLAF